MEQPNPQQPYSPVPKRSFKLFIKKYYWHLIVFFVIATTSGILMADHESKSTTSWQTFTSTEAGLSFKYPKQYKIVEDKGWRITVYTSELSSENNIKIIYSARETSDEANSVGSQIAASCQPAKVNQINAANGQFKVYEDNVCSGQHIGDTILAYPENNMNYDISLFGKPDMPIVYTFLSTFTFENTAVAPSPIPSPTQMVPVSVSPVVTRTEGKMCGGIAAIPCPSGYSCKLDGDFPDAGGKCIQETKPKETTMCTMDAKECPDGTFVGRTGPTCEFVCPR